MKRYSKGFIILKKDLASNKVQKKEYKNDFYEYWIYKEKTSSLMGIDGKYLGTGDFELSVIIACEHNSNHIKGETEKAYFVEGYRFTDDEQGNDLSEYRNKTGGR